MKYNRKLGGVLMINLNQHSSCCLPQDPIFIISNSVIPALVCFAVAELWMKGLLNFQFVILHTL
jgi:hypothetical protein